MEPDYVEIPSKKLSPDVDGGSKKLPAGRKKLSKDSLGKGEPMVSTFPRKGTSRSKALFDNDFVPSDENPIIRDTVSKFNFESDLSGVESPVINRSLKGGLINYVIFFLNNNVFGLF